MVAKNGLSLRADMGEILNTFDSQKWLTCHFSLNYLYIFQQTCYENVQTYQVEFVALILHQILITYFTRKRVAARRKN